MGVEIKKRKNGQATMALILAIAVVCIVGLYFFVRGDATIKKGESAEENPDAFLKSCLEEEIIKTTSMISEHGGYKENPLNIGFKFDDEDVHTPISYLCYTQGYYLPCVNQEPMLIQHLKSEIKKEIDARVKECFNEMASSLEKESYEVESNYNGFEIELSSKKIIVNIDGGITKTKTEETSKQEGFQAIIPSRFYDIAIVVQEIVYQEAKYCNFDVGGFMMFYPDVKIEKFRTTDSVTIYRLEDKKSREKFKFAVRSCVIPPGI